MHSHHSHSHHDHHGLDARSSQELISSTKRRIIWAIGLNVLITGSEFAAGVYAQSIALMTDALHNLSDVLALALSLLGLYLLQVKSSKSKTYGYRRIELLIGLINSLVLIFMGILALQAAMQRLLSPSEVAGLPVMIFSLVSVVLNGLSVLILTRGSGKKSVSIRSSILHLFSDMLTSIAVFIGGFAVYKWQQYWIDPSISIFVGLYVLTASFSILRYSISYLLNFSPKGLKIEKLEERLCSVPEVDNVHHLHIWHLNENEIHLEAHVAVTQDFLLSKLMPLRAQLCQILHDEFRIKHASLVFECEENCEPSLIADE